MKTKFFHRRDFVKLTA